jgi:hypothetical protein
MGRENWDILLIAGRLVLSISMVRYVSNNQFDSCIAIATVTIHKAKIY